MKVPDILVSGNHKEIKSWRRRKSIERTLERRRDLISDENYKESPQSKRISKEYEYEIYPDW
jgi:2-C-methyl-D-erythritol 2,4-cyclodiphosphate synthase